MDKSLPHNIDSERIVIGSILSNVNAYSDVSVILSHEMFYDKTHSDLYRNIVELSEKGKPVDIVMLSEIYDDDNTTLHKIVDISCCYSVDYYEHALNIYEKYIRRKLLIISQQLSLDVFSIKETSELIFSLQKDIESIHETTSSSDIHDLKSALKSVYKQIENNLNGDYLTGTDTGFNEINRASGGLQKSDLIIIAGETGSGKTSSALSIVDKAAKSGESVAIYSMEMKKEQCAARLLSMNCGIPSSKILYSKLESEHLDILDNSVNKIYNLPVYFDDKSTSNIDMIIASIRSIKIKYNITGAVIDYLQILNVNQKSQNKEQAMGDVARRLKNLAKELDIWIIALSQLNRDSQNPVPNLNRLRDSGQIAEAADIVMFIYRPEMHGKYYPEPFANYSTKGTAMIDISKGRNIGTLKFICGFDAKTTSFTDLNNEPIKIDEENQYPF